MADRSSILNAVNIAIRNTNETLPHDKKIAFDESEQIIGTGAKIDSLAFVTLMVAVEKELGGDVEESAMAEIYTVRQLVDAIRESAAAGKTRTSSSRQPAGWSSGPPGTSCC